MERRVRLRFTILLPFLFVALFVWGISLAGVGHGDYRLIMCVALPWSLIWLAVASRAADIPVACFLVILVGGPLAQYTLIGYWIDKWRDAPPRTESQGYGFGKCPSCGQSLAGSMSNRCPNCREKV